MKGISSYCDKIFEMRYFIFHLVKLDLKNKYRRSKLGILWTLLFPLGLSSIMGLVFSVAFNYDIISYMPYILSGLLFWDLVSGAYSAGGMSLLAHDSFIRQCNHPLSMYTFKNSIVTTINFLIALISLLIWIIILSPKNLLIGFFSLPFTIIIYFFFTWAGTTIAGFTCVKYRDYPMMAPLVLQVIWYVSPVFFEERMFKSSPILYKWFMVNPITHLLNLIREPFLNGRMPGYLDYAISIAFMLVVCYFAYKINKNNEKDLIFYL